MILSPGHYIKNTWTVKTILNGTKITKKSVNSLRACINGGQAKPNQGGQVTQRPIVTQESTQKLLTPSKDTVNCNYGNQDTYACSKPINEGYNNPQDSLFADYIGSRLEASHVNKVHCLRYAHDYSCTITYERVQSTKYSSSTVYCTSQVQLSTCESRKPMDGQQQFNQCPSNQIQVTKMDQHVCRNY